MSFSIPFLRRPVTVLSIAVFGIGLSVSDIDFAQTAQTAAAMEPVQSEAAVAVQAAAVAPVTAPVPAVVESDADETADSAGQTGVSAQDAECLAKIVQHEARNQTDRVQLAVAQVVLNRLKSSVFPSSICAVAMQRGQFFNVNAYHPYANPRWSKSQEIARRALAGEGLSIAPDALYFHTAGASSVVSRSHPRIGRLGGLDFYR